MSKKINFLIDVDASNLALPLESTSSGDGGVGTDLGTLGGFGAWRQCPSRGSRLCRSHHARYWRMRSCVLWRVDRQERIGEDVRFVGLPGQMSQSNQV